MKAKAEGLEWPLPEAQGRSGVRIQSAGLTKGSGTFNYRERLLPALPRFALVIALAYSVNLLTVMTAIHFSINSYLAQAAGVARYTLLSYLGMRFFVFPTGIEARPS